VKYFTHSSPWLLRASSNVRLSLTYYCAIGLVTITVRNVRRRMDDEPFECLISTCDLLCRTPAPASHSTPLEMYVALTLLFYCAID
jgi:hypothetical protein